MLRVRLHDQSKQRLQENNKHHVDMAKPSPTTHSMDDPDIVKRVYIPPIDPERAIYEEDIGTHGRKGGYLSQMRAYAPAVDGMSEILESTMYATAETPISSLDARSLSSFPCSVDGDTDPSDSLLVLAPLDMAGCEHDEAATQKRPGFTSKRRSLDAPSTTWRDWLVTLFAGRKPALSAHNPPKRTDSFICPSADTESAPQPPKASEKQDTTPATAHKHTAPCTHPPRPLRLLLPLPTVLPSARTPESPLVAHCPCCTRISPAPLTAYTGYAVVADDEHPPETVVRGFDAPGRSAIAGPPPKRYNAAASLLHRDRDAWPGWDRSITCAADLPFGKVHAGRASVPRGAGGSPGERAGRCEADWLDWQDASRCSKLGVGEWPFSQCCYW